MIYDIFILSLIIGLAKLLTKAAKTVNILNHQKNAKFDQIWG